MLFSRVVTFWDFTNQNPEKYFSKQHLKSIKLHNFAYKNSELPGF